jgi:hypothetical protein
MLNDKDNSVATYPLNFYASGATDTFQNNTLYKMVRDNGTGVISGVRGGGTDTNRFLQNNIVIDVSGTTSGAKKCYDDWSGATENYNISSDTTAAGTGSQINITAASLFLSTVPGGENLHLKTGAPAIGTGIDLETTPTGVQFDIDGYDRDASGVVWDVGADQFGMPTITKTIGTDSRDYSTMATWEADLDNGAIYSAGDVAVGLCYNDSGFTGSLALNGGGTIGLTTANIKPAPGQGHTGIAGTGVKLIGNIISGQIFRLFTTVGVPYTGEGIEVTSSVIMTSASGQATNYGTIGNITRRMLVYDVIFSGGGNNAGTAGGDGAIINCIFYNLTVTNIAAGAMDGMRVTAAGTYLNNTLYNLINDNGTGIIRGIWQGGSTGTVRNNIVLTLSGTSSGAKDCFILGAGTTRTNNMSSDATATGTNSLINKSATNQFVSIVGGSENLHLKEGSEAIGAGVDLVNTPTGIEFDIDGFNRNGVSRKWDMGADQIYQSDPTYHYYRKYLAGI